MNIISKIKNNIIYNEQNTYIDDDIKPNTVPTKGPQANKKRKREVKADTKVMSQRIQELKK